jgi:hypothetical protein
MSITGRIILKWMLVNYDMKEWTGVQERIQGRAFVIMMMNLQAHRKADNLLTALSAIL